ncbi:MAG TPA: hypothetical protein VJ890_10270 [Vineibacter sp.]|nr:hypothetical protein [Vineibacter sp.]
MAEERKLGDDGDNRSPAPESLQGVPIDGRALRRLRTHEMIVEACRQMMVAGVLRPDSRSLAARSDVSHRTLFWHFPRLQDVYREALEDAAVAAAVERRIPTDRAGILRAVVLGEVGPDGIAIEPEVEGD